MLSVDEKTICNYYVLVMQCFLAEPGEMIQMSDHDLGHKRWHDLLGRQSLRACYIHQFMAFEPALET